MSRLTHDCLIPVLAWALVFIGLDLPLWRDITFGIGLLVLFVWWTRD